MSRRNYGQFCSLASALDRIGERWSLLIVRELMLGPLRFSDLARSAGGVPTDILTKRLRDLEADGIVRRRELDPPAAATVYELTEVGRELDEPLLAIGRWGLNFFTLEDPGEISSSSWLPNVLRMALRPPEGASLVLQLRSDGQSAWARIADGRLVAERGEAPEPDLVLSGTLAEVIGLVVVGDEAGGEVEVEGDRAVLEELRRMVDLPVRLRAEIEAATTVQV